MHGLPNDKHHRVLDGLEVAAEKLNQDASNLHTAYEDSTHTIVGLYTRRPSIGNQSISLFGITWFYQELHYTYYT